MKKHSENLNKIKVLMVGPYPPPYGGVAIVVRDLMNSSLTKDFHMRLLRTEPPGKNEVYRVVLDIIRLFRSFLESSGYALKLMLDAIEETTKVTINDLRISGGASRNDLLLQIIADITGREVKAVYEPDAAIGSVILAMANITRKNLEKIAEKTIKIRASYLPNQEHYETYIKLVEKYKEIIFSLNKIFS